ncbi:hypothetical protein ACFSCZ_04490 [Siminovitchia sediminis]|uniref:Uncharacterized protein n=1 Tax=Siminovitchia sediminis TaxID=1274353 RepID=A0ABW4KDX5_9BACI
MQGDDREKTDYTPHFKQKRKPIDETLEWSPTGYGFIASVSSNDTQDDSRDD